MGRKKSTRVSVYRKYTDSFKRKVIEEYLRVGNKSAILRKYNIPYVSALQDWMRCMAYTDHWRQGESGTFELSNSLPLSNKDQKAEELQKRIRQLERQLEDEKLRSEGYRRMIKIAETELKIQIEKKPGTK
jgi:transposase-like protein